MNEKGIHFWTPTPALNNDIWIKQFLKKKIMGPLYVQDVYKKLNWNLNVLHSLGTSVKAVLFYNFIKLSSTFLVERGKEQKTWSHHLEILSTSIYRCLCGSAAEIRQPFIAHTSKISHQVLVLEFTACMNIQNERKYKLKDRKFKKRGEGESAAYFQEWEGVSQSKKLLWGSFKKGTCCRSLTSNHRRESWKLH